MAKEPGNYGDYYVLAIEPGPEPAGDAESDDNCSTILVLITLALCFLPVICCEGLAFFFTRGPEPGYSVQLTGVQGIDPCQNPAVSPAFNLTVHVDNKEHKRRVCREESNVIVYYNEASDGFKETSIGWGKMAAFCVDGRSEIRNLSVSLSNQGVFLSRRLREKMESHRQSQQMKISVEMKPTHPEESFRPYLTLCEGKFGQSLEAAPAMQCYPLSATETMHYYRPHQRPSPIPKTYHPILI